MDAHARVLGAPAQAPANAIDDATVAKIVQEVTGDGVWVDPAFARAHDISAQDETRLEQAVAASDYADLRVVLVEVDPDDDRFQGSFSSLSAWIQDSAGGDATYVGWQESSEPPLAVDAYGDQPDPIYVANVAAHDHPDDLVAQVVQVQELLDDGNAEALWMEVPRDERYSWTADDGSSVPWWAIVGIVAALLVACVMVWKWVAGALRRRRPTGFVLPPAVLRTVRAAEDRQLRERAETEVLALGEAIAESESASGSPEALDAWQQSLDHYAAARDVLDRAGSPADVVGALVLARRGESARDAALQRPARRWQPPLGCWFNPLHRGTTTEVTWRDEDRAVDVPACQECAEAVRAGREPDDVLDFIDGERTVHYFRLDIGAWSATGYGSLRPDLLGALRERRAFRRGRG
ncbi:hypothetical protein [Nocardioides sp. LHG3406-4]|uniref:hypothetical protein n=1 Tax=Nocardioides sp. LHG3406-4 TaxID=2804575 RepID=UPI003CED6FCE